MHGACAKPACSTPLPKWIRPCLPTGFSERIAASLRERLDRIKAPACPVRGLKIGAAVWVAPDVRALIAYRGVTTAGELRHASFKGLEE